MKTPDESAAIKGSTSVSRAQAVERGTAPSLSVHNPTTTAACDSGQRVGLDARISLCGPIFESRNVRFVPGQCAVCTAVAVHVKRKVHFLWGMSARGRQGSRRLSDAAGATETVRSAGAYDLELTAQNAGSFN